MMLIEGQELWYMPDESYRTDREPSPVYVEKIGRRWATLCNNAGRVDKETLRMDGGSYSSPGRCYLSREAWETETADRAAWHSLRQGIDKLWEPPSGVTAEIIARAAALLHITQPPKAG